MCTKKPNRRLGVASETTIRAPPQRDREDLPDHNKNSTCQNQTAQPQRTFQKPSPSFPYSNTGCAFPSLPSQHLQPQLTAPLHLAFTAQSHLTSYPQLPSLSSTRCRQDLGAWLFPAGPFLCHCLSRPCAILTAQMPASSRRMASLTPWWRKDPLGWPCRLCLLLFRALHTFIHAHTLLLIHTHTQYAHAHSHTYTHALHTPYTC